MNCQKIEGVAEKLSNNNTLYYKMRIVVDSVKKTAENQILLLSVIFNRLSLYLKKDRETFIYK